MKPDVEMTVVDFDGKTVDSETPKDSTTTGDSSQTASASNTRHVHFSGT